MSEILTNGALKFTEANTPTRVGEFINTISEIYDIPTPRLGMLVYVRDEGKNYTITGLKEKIIEGVVVNNAQVDTYRCAEQELRDNIGSVTEGLSSQIAATSDALNKAISTGDAEIKSKAAQYDTFNAPAYRDKMQLSFKTIDGKVKDVDLPAATITTAGVMTAEDKAKLNRVSEQQTLVSQAQTALQQQVNNIKPIEIKDSTVVNAPDEEDITMEGNVLKFKDRSAGNGLGYIILRAGKSFAEQLTQTNTIYEIRYNFDLDGASVTIPENCVLKFEGGSLRNGVLTGDKTTIEAQVYARILDTTVVLNGTWNDQQLSVCWFGALPHTSFEYTSDVSFVINYCLTLPFRTIFIPQGYYYISSSIRVTLSDKTILMEGYALDDFRANIGTQVYTDKNVPIIKVEYTDGKIGPVNILNGKLLVKGTVEHSCGLIELVGSETSKIWGGEIKTSLRGPSSAQFNANGKGIYIYTTAGYVTFVNVQSAIRGCATALEIDDRQGGWVSTIYEENEVNGCRQAVVAHSHGLNVYKGRYQCQALVPNDKLDEYPMLYTQGLNCTIEANIIDVGHTYEEYSCNKWAIELGPNDRNIHIGGQAAYLRPRFVKYNHLNLDSSDFMYEPYASSRGVRRFNPILDNFLAEGKNVTKSFETKGGCTIRWTDGYLNPYAKLRPQAQNLTPESEVIATLTFQNYLNNEGTTLIPLAFCCEMPDGDSRRFKKITIELIGDNDKVLSASTKVIEYNNDSDAVSNIYFTDWEFSRYSIVKSVRITYSNPTSDVVYVGRLYMKAETVRHMSVFDTIQFLGSVRPTEIPPGQYFFDTALNKPIWWTGSSWVDADGTTV